MRNVGQLPGHANTKSEKNGFFYVFFRDEQITGRVGCMFCARKNAYAVAAWRNRGVRFCLPYRQSRASGERLLNLNYPNNGEGGA